MGSDVYSTCSYMYMYNCRGVCIVHVHAQCTCTHVHMYTCTQSCRCTFLSNGIPLAPLHSPSQISYIPASVGDSMVQLNAPDCVWKLSQDLLYLFVYQPTADFTRPLDELLNVYAKCFHHKLVPAVYQAKTVQQVMKSKQINKFIKVHMPVYLC